MNDRTDGLPAGYPVQEALNPTCSREAVPQQFSSCTTSPVLPSLQQTPPIWRLPCADPALCPPQWKLRAPGDWVYVFSLARGRTERCPETVLGGGGVARGTLGIIREPVRVCTISLNSSLALSFPRIVFSLYYKDSFVFFSVFKFAGDSLSVWKLKFYL